MIAKWFSCLAEGHCDYCFENDKPFGLRGIMIDITKNKEAEKILKNF
jgi:hypothetical protein